jgi:translation initiation factor 2 alpha subunit (eIF-2alpha)
MAHYQTIKMPKTEIKEEVTAVDVELQSFNFPDHGVTIEAENYVQALEILQQITQKNNK